MNDATTSPARPADEPTRPEVAVVVVDRQGRDDLPRALETLMEFSRAYRFDVLVLRAIRPAGPPAGGLPLTVHLIEVDADRPDAAWRARAMAETAADIVEFVDAARVSAIPWDDVVPRRLGLVRLDREKISDLRDRLARAGVPEPAATPGRHG